MSHFMAENCGKAGFILGHRKNSRIDRNLPAWECEGILILIILNHRDLPFKLLGSLGVEGDFRRLNNPSRDTLDRFDFTRVVRNLHFRIMENLIISLNAHCLFLRSGDQLQLVSMGIGIRGAACDRHDDEKHLEPRQKH